MIRFTFILLFVTVFSVSVYGQNMEADLKKSFNKFSVVKINNREALRKAKSGTPFNIRFNDRNIQFALNLNDVRSANYTAEYTDNNGRHSLPRGEVQTYQGTIVGEPNSLVAMTIDGTKTEGYFATATEGYFVESAKNYSSRAGENDKVIYRVKDKVDGDDNVCGLDEVMAEGMKSATSDAAVNNASTAQTGRRVLEVATEASKVFVQNPILGNGNPAKANNHILSVMNQVDAVYRRDLNLRVVVTFQHAWMPDTTDPYENLVNRDLLYAFTDYWNVAFPISNPTYHRDVAHLFTLNGGDGRAILGGTCPLTSSSYSFTSFLYANKWVITAHELGHNLGADHACPGSIMSGGVVATEFCQFSIDQITNHINTYGRNCLELDSTVSAPLFDFDGDGKADISVFRPSNGFWYVMKSSGGFSSTQWGLGTDDLVPGDYDGDRKTDIAVYRNMLVPIPGENSVWYILRSSDSTFQSKVFGFSGGVGSSDSPLPADYDGDGKTDIAVYSSTDIFPSPIFFKILQSSDNSRVVTQWGLSADQRVPADYDGDGKADLAVFRTDNFPGSTELNTWFILQSSNNVIRVERFGFRGDQIVPGDYDRDGKTDLAVWRPSNGFWYYIKSSNGAFNGSFSAVQFGASDDKPVPADYDGDGKTDIAVFRPSNGVWYLLKSTEGFSAQQFGFGDDIPIPNVFVRQSF